MEEDAPPNEEHGDGPKNGQETHEPWRERQDPPTKGLRKRWPVTLRQSQAEVIKLNDRGDQAINPNRRNDCHDGKTALGNRAIDCTVPSAITIISAERTKSVRIAPLT